MNTEYLGLIRPGMKVLVALSGGADSVCLLHKLKNTAGIEVFAAHFEHGIRGEESLRDAAFCEKLCVELGVEIAVGHGNVPERAAELGMGMEETARKLRYEFLENARSRFGCHCIATAHNADDNAETVIFNLLRGSAGVRGIPPVNGSIIRPLLSVTREEIEAYIAANQLPHVEDSTNASDDYSRNRIRHSIMPILRELNPSVSRSILRASMLSAKDEEYFSSEAMRFIATEYRGGFLPLDKLRALPESISSRVIRELAPKNLEYCHVESIMELMNSTERKKLSVPGTTVLIEQGRLYFEAPEALHFADRELVLGGTTEIPEIGIRLHSEFTVYTEEIHGLFKTLVFKNDIICDRIFCTARREGDRMRPVGRGCSKSLKQLFLENKYTRSQRDSALVLRDKNGILAVACLALDERAAAKPGDRVLRIDIERTDGNA